MTNVTGEESFHQTCGGQIEDPRHAVALAEAAQQALEQTLRAFEKHRQPVFERLEAKQR
jgi:hypothetical protein